MSDDPSNKDEGGKPQEGDSGGLEITPSWDAKSEGAKGEPRRVAVRREGDVAEAMQPSAADDLYVEETAKESVQVEKERRLGVVLLIVLLLAVGGAITWKILRVEIEVSATVSNNHFTNSAWISAKVRTTHDVQVGVEGHGDAEAVSPGGSDLRFEVKFDKLKLGENALKLQVSRAGEVLAEREVVVYRDFDLKIDKDKVANPPHPLYLRFSMAPGWSVRFNGEDYEPDSKGVAKLRVSMKAVFSTLGRFTDPSYEFDVPLTITRKGGEQFAHNVKVDIMLPQARLQLDTEADAIVTTAKKATISGSADPGAKVMVGATEAKVDEEGRFSASVKLPKSKKFSVAGVKDLAAALTAIRSAVEEGHGINVPVVAQVEGKVPSLRELLVIRSKSKSAKKFNQLAAAAN